MRAKHNSRDTHTTQRRRKGVEVNFSHSTRICVCVRAYTFKQNTLNAAHATVAVVHSPTRLRKMFFVRRLFAVTHFAGTTHDRLCVSHHRCCTHKCRTHSNRNSRYCARVQMMFCNDAFAFARNTTQQHFRTYIALSTLAYSLVSLYRVRACIALLAPPNRQSYDVCNYYCIADVRLAHIYIEYSNIMTTPSKQCSTFLPVRPQAFVF